MQLRYRLLPVIAVIIFLLLITKNIENAHYREEYLPNVFHQSGIQFKCLIQ